MVLVGRSGTGKSNIVQSLRFLRNILINFDQAVRYEGGWDRIIPAGSKSFDLQIEVVFVVPGEDADYRYFIRFSPNDHNPTPLLMAESLQLGETKLFDRERVFNRERSRGHWEWRTAPALANAPPLSDGPMLGAFPSLQKVIFAYAALSSGLGYYHLPSTALTEQLQPPHELLKTVAGLWDNAANYRDTLRGITQDFHRPSVRKNLLASLRAVNPSIVSIELDSLTNPQRAIVGHEASGRIFDLALEQESDGLRRFYATLLALYQTPAKLAMVFEEPENAIFPGALAILADEFKAAPREHRGQVILTTHSPSLLDKFEVDNIRVVDMLDGKTIVGPVANEQREAIREHLLTTGELLTVETPRIEAVNGAGLSA